MANKQIEDYNMNKVHQNKDLINKTKPNPNGRSSHTSSHFERKHELRTFYPLQHIYRAPSSWRHTQWAGLCLVTQILTSVMTQLAPARDMRQYALAPPIASNHTILIRQIKRSISNNLNTNLMSYKLQMFGNWWQWLHNCSQRIFWQFKKRSGL